MAMLAVTLVFIVRRFFMKCLKKYHVFIFSYPVFPFLAVVVAFEAV